MINWAFQHLEKNVISLASLGRDFYIFFNGGLVNYLVNSWIKEVSRALFLSPLPHLFLYVLGGREELLAFLFVVIEGLLFVLGGFVAVYIYIYIYKKKKPDHKYELQLRVLYYHHAGILHCWSDSRLVWFTVSVAILYATTLPPMQLHCKEWRQKPPLSFLLTRNLKFRGGNKPWRIVWISCWTVDRKYTWELQTLKYVYWGIVFFYLK